MNPQETRPQASTPLRPGGQPGPSRIVVVANTGVAPRALQRVAMLPLAQGAEVCVLLGRGPALPQGRGSAADVLGEPGAHLAALLRTLEGTLSVRSLPEGEDATVAVEQLCARLQAELVVVERTPKGLLASVRGTPPEKLVRHGQVPVLLLHRAAERPYRRIVVGVDLSETSRAALGMALRLRTRESEPIDVFHAYDTGYALVMHQAYHPTGSLLGYYEQRRHEAQAALRHFLDQTRAAQGASLRLVLASGEPTDELKRAVKESHADLLVLGKHARQGLGHTLLGSVAEGCVRGVDCDVLVVPEPGAPVVH